MTAPAFDAAARERFLQRFGELDAALVAAGFPPTSPWWREQIARFVRSGCRRWGIRAGRRAGKSTTLCRLAVAWALFGPGHVPPGDVPVVSFVSVSRDESAARLKTIAAIATTLGLAHEPRADELELTGARGAVCRTFAATTRSVVGHTSIAIFGDEVARWESRDTAANPAREVAGSLTPTLATQPHGFAVWSSSPWGTDDYHAELFDAGDSEQQCVSYAPTWVANPTLTEARTHELEPDERTWSREYAAIPGSTISSAFDRDDVLACFGRSTTADVGSGWLTIDASSLRGDAFAWMAGGVSSGGELVVHEVAGYEGEQLRHVSMSDVVRRIAGRARALRIGMVFGDQREEAALRALFGEHGVELKSYAWTEQSKDEAMQLLRRLMRERRVVLRDHPRLRSELSSMKARLVPSGRIRYETGGLDYASCLITLAHAIAGHLVRVEAWQGDDDCPVITAPSERGYGGSGRAYERLSGAARRKAFLNDE